MPARRVALWSLPFCSGVLITAAPARADRIITEILPPNQANIFIEDAASGKRFQAYKGDHVGPSETLDIAGDAVVVIVRDTDTNQLHHVTRRAPLKPSDTGVIGRVLTTLLDAVRFTSRPGASQSGVRCAASPDISTLDVPILAGDAPQMRAGRHAIGFAIVAPADAEVGADLSMGGAIVAHAPVRAGRWQSPLIDLVPGRYALTLHSGKMTVERGFEVVATAPAFPTALEHPVATVDPDLARALWLTRGANGAWRLEAAQILLRIPADRRTDAYEAVLSVLEQGIRLDKEAEIGACFG